MKDNIRKIATGGILAAVWAFMIAIYAPVEFYIFNNEEVWFDIYDMLPTVIIVFAVFLVFNFALMCIIRVINIRLYRGLCFVETILLVYTYIQGNYLAVRLPGLDGTIINWSDYHFEVILSIIIFIVILAIFVFIVLHFKFKIFMKSAKIIGLCMFVIMVGTLVFNIVENSYTFFRAKIDQNVTVKDEMLYSSNKNMIILLLDRIESEDVEQFMAEEPDKYADCFEDFTYYRDAMGGYPRTQFSIPLILTGNQYKNEEDYYDFYTRSVLESPLFSNLEERDYSMAVYDVNYFYCYDPSVFDRFTNILETKLQPTSVNAFAAMLMRVIGFRYAPYGVKHLFEADRVDFKEIEMGRYDYGYELFTWFNGELYNLLKEQDIELEEKNHFKFIHLEGGHRPYDLTADVEQLSKKNEYPDEDTDFKQGKVGYKEKEKSGLTVARTLINELKESGIYDNSIIVVLSDHGDYYHETYKAQNPFLLVKGFNEHHPLSVNMAPISYITDLQDGFENLMDGKFSHEIFNVKEGDKRTRQYLFYDDWREHEIMYEYEQTGMSNDMNTFIATGVEFAKPTERWKDEDIDNAKVMKNKKVPEVTINGEDINSNDAEEDEQ